jgi:hypothetical protein
MERIFVTNFSGLKRIFQRCASNQCDAALAADHDEKKEKIWIIVQVSKRKKTFKNVEICKRENLKGSSLTGFLQEKENFTSRKIKNSRVQLNKN